MTHALYVPNESLQEIRSSLNSAVCEVETVGSRFDPHAMSDLCITARETIGRLQGCEDDALFRAEKFRTRPRHILLQFNDALERLALLNSADRGVLFLHSVNLLLLGDPLFLQAMQVHLRHTVDALHFAMVGCEFIETVSGCNYLLELENWCPLILRADSVQRFVEEVGERVGSPRWCTAQYLSLAPGERKATSPWKMMEHFGLLSQRS